MKKLLVGSATFALMIGAANAADLPVVAAPPSPAFSWAGLYIGGHVGGMFGTASFDDPLGPSLFGDRVRTPGFLGGAQLGYSFQAPGAPWVFGLEGDVSGLASDGTNTCLAFSALFVSANCRSRPFADGTVTARVGYALGAQGHTLVYGKAGGAWLNEDVDITTNRSPPLVLATSTSRTGLGWTAGAGVEQALTPAWSLRLEYDFLQFGSFGVATPPGAILEPGGRFLGLTPPTTTHVSQNVQELKLGVNYRFNADPWASWNAAADAAPYPVKAPVSAPGWMPGWEFEAGARYVYGFGRFQKDLTPPSLVSRLTYADLRTNAGELFGRLDLPQNIMVKGLIGFGGGRSGHMNDEDWAQGGRLLAYSNTLSAPVHDDITYGLIDVGYDVLRTRDYKIAPFVGYTAFRSDMAAFGCTPIAAGNCIPPVPSTGAPIITEDDTWQALRVGVAGEVMVSPQIKLSADAAYLPYATVSGVDDHFFGNTGVLNRFFSESGTGQGVQIEALLAYYITPQFSVGIGGRFWSAWTTAGHYATTIVNPSAGEAVGTFGPFAGQFKTEQSALFVQLAYAFGRQ